MSAPNHFSSWHKNRPIDFSLFLYCLSVPIVSNRHSFRGLDELFHWNSLKCDPFFPIKWRLFCYLHVRLFCMWLLTVVFVIAVVDSCTSSEYEIRVEKKTLAWASEESYQILHNDVLLATSETFTNNAIRSYYHCIRKTSDGMYTLVMKDRFDEQCIFLGIALMIPGLRELIFVSSDRMVSLSILDLWLRNLKRDILLLVMSLLWTLICSDVSHWNIFFLASD